MAAGLVFLASGAVLVLEILGVRLLAPYVGLTLQTTTAIIGAVLAGIAGGAALGGLAADLFPPRRLLALLLGGGGVLALLTVPVVRLLGPALEGSGDLGALAVTFASLMPAAAVLSAVTPTVAKLQLRELGSTGSVFGRLSGWATAGALVGTFITGFVLVPALPVSTSVVAVGAVLVAMGLAAGLRGGGVGVAGAALLVVLAVASATASVAVASPCDAESTYHCANVETDPHRPSGRVLVLDDLRHSYVDLDDPRHLEFDYTRWIGDAVGGLEPRGRPLAAVFAGGGGFTLPRYLAATRPGSRSRVLEVDGDLVDLARDRLGLRTSPALRVLEGDARMTMRDERTGSADLVVGDAFGGRAVPWHLATIEWTREVRRVLRPGGLYALNVIDEGELRLVRAEAATLLEVFADVRLIALPGPAGGNLVLLASERRLPRSVASRAPGRAHVRPRRRGAPGGGSDPLTDDDAPADQLLDAP